MGVMSVKRTTTIASGDHSGGGTAASRGSEGTISTISAMDEQKALGGQNVGDVLNKLSDANYVDPSKKHRAAGNAQLDKDAFMKLMLAQMKYQDPQNPMQSHEMAAQLAQFTSLEQLNNIHTTLESMKNAQSPSTNYQALNFIGKKIASDSSRITRTAGDTTHPMSFQLLGDATKTKITIHDASGATVRTLTPGALKKGPNSVVWNGMNEDGVATRPGEYKMSIEAETASGTKVYAKTQLEGRITGLNYTAEGPILMVGDQSVKMSEVKKIEEAGPEMGATPLTSGAMPPGLGAAGAGPVAGQVPGVVPGQVPAQMNEQIAAMMGAMKGASNPKEALMQSLQKASNLNGMMPTATQAAPMRAGVVNQATAQTQPPELAMAHPRMTVKPESKGAPKPGMTEAEKQKAAMVEKVESAMKNSKSTARVEEDAPKAAPKTSASVALQGSATQSAENSAHGSKSEIAAQDSKANSSGDNMNVPPAEDPLVQGNIESVPMAQGLLNKLAQAK